MRQGLFGKSAPYHHSSIRGCKPWPSPAAPIPLAALDIIKESFDRVQSIPSSEPAELCQPLVVLPMLHAQGVTCRPARLLPVHAVLVRPRTVRCQASLLQWALRPAQTKVVDRKQSRPVVQESTAEQVQARLAQHVNNPSTTTSLIIMFTAHWCGPCSLVYKELTKLGGLRPGSLEVLSIDVDEECNKEFASDLNITSLPCLVFIGRDPAKKTISTIGHVSSSLIADVLDNKMHLCGANLKERLRLS